MDLNDNRPGYWTGMPARLKARAMVWSMYWALAIWLVTLGSLFGFSLIAVPILWVWAKAWFLDRFLELDSDEIGLLDYTLAHIWNSSVYVRSFFMVTTLALALGGLVWLGTEDLRKEAAAPTLTEQVSEKASGMVDATKDTTKGWIATAKGWFSGDDETPHE